MHDISFIQASTSDIPLIRTLADTAFRHTYKDILCPEQMEWMMEWMYSEESLKGQIEGSGKHFLICFCDGTPCGYVSFEHESDLPDGRPMYHLQKLYLLPQFQRQGMGRTMVEKVKETLGAGYPGGFRIELNVNRHNPSVQFYESIGFHRDRQGDFPIGDGWYMNDYIYAYEQ